MTNKSINNSNFELRAVVNTLICKSPEGYSGDFYYHIWMNIYSIPVKLSANCNHTVFRFFLL